MKVYFIALFIFSSIVGNAQNVNIPDELFKEFLITNTEININGDNDIQLHEAEGFNGEIDVTGEIDPYYIGIKDLTGIETFKLLKILKCGYNSLISLEINNLKSLEYLDCIGNELINLDLADNPLLVHLNCAGNYIESLNLSNNLKLSFLNFSNNSLFFLDLRNGNNRSIEVFSGWNNLNLNCISVNDVEFAKSNWSSSISATVFNESCNVYIPDPEFKSILIEETTLINRNGDSEIQLYEAFGFDKYISLSFHNIKDLTGIEEFVNLKGLYCNNNLLTKLDLSSNRALEYLNCKENNLDSLILGDNQIIEEIDCHSNGLKYIDIAGCFVLKELKCHINNLEILDLTNNIYLRELNCSSNSLTRLDLRNNSNQQLNLFNAIGNPDLKCISVTDLEYAENNWVLKDEVATFSTRCDAIANFTSNKVSGSAPLLVQFFNESEGFLTFWSWDFDLDGREDSIDKNPSYVYEKPGVYSVSLVVGNSSASDTLILENFIDVGMYTSLNNVIDLSFSSIKIYPNPFEKWINLKIQNELSITEIEINSMLGIPLLEIKNIKENEIRLDLGQIPQRIMIVKLFDQDGNIYIQKIVKQQ